MTTASFERLLGHTLAAGVTISTALLAVGLFLSLSSPGSSADGLLNAGILVLMVTPVTRVVLSSAEFVRERDWFFAVIAICVLGVLAMTFWTALSR